jgi:Flp pilus assembly protein TadD
MDERIAILERRGRRLRTACEYRKAANAYGELTAIQPGAARWWVMLGVMLYRANRAEEATKALRQATYLFRREGRTGCVDSVRRLEKSLVDPNAEAA